MFPVRIMAALASLSGLLLLLPCSAVAQTAPEPIAPLPLSTPISDVEIGLFREGHGGCNGRCVRYRITVSGDGTVTYQDLIDDSQAVRRQRSISGEEVVILVNDFLRAGFLEALDRYVGGSFYVRKGNALVLSGRGGADGTTWDLSLQLGSLKKSVHLYMDYPEALGKLRDQVEKVGGPQVWTQR